MDNKKYDLRRIILSTSFICFLCVVFLTLSGCAPLRKKFTRQKKKDRQSDPRFIPVLDPVEYPEKIYSSEEKYRYHYSLWKVWGKDFLQVLERDGSGKRQRYLLSQSIEQLDEMKVLLNDAQQAELKGLIDELGTVLLEYDKQSAMRNKFSIRSKVTRNSSKIRNGFSPKVLFRPQE